MKIYIERRIESEKDLPKKDGFYYIHYKNPGGVVHTQMSVVYYYETIKGLWLGKDWFDYWLEPIEVDKGAEEIWAKWRKTWLDENNVLTKDPYVIKAMKEHAAIQVAKALNKPTDEDIEEWARSESIAKVEDEDGNIQEFVTPIMEWLIKGAKAALSGEIKKKVK